jgi:hypothetical protein
MAVVLYLDAHVPQAIADQLGRRGVDVVTAIEDGCALLPDDQLLERARVLGRVLLTQDIRFRAQSEDWQREGRPFAGILFGHQLGAIIGRTGFKEYTLTPLRPHNKKTSSKAGTFRGPTFISSA